jgi:predicted nucleic acid-binding protein
MVDEVANVTELAVRKGRISEDKARSFLASLGDLPIDIENPLGAHTFTEVRRVATEHKLTVYDAAYLEMAIRHELPIATLDNAMATAAKGERLTLVEK